MRPSGRVRFAFRNRHVASHCARARFARALRTGSTLGHCVCPARLNRQGAKDAKELIALRAFSRVPEPRDLDRALATGSNLPWRPRRHGGSLGTRCARAWCEAPWRFARHTPRSCGAPVRGARRHGGSLGTRHARAQCEASWRLISVATTLAVARGLRFVSRDHRRNGTRSAQVRGTTHETQRHDECT